MKSRLISEYPESTVDFVPFVDLRFNGVEPTDVDALSYVIVPEFGEPVWPGSPVMRDATTQELGFILDGPSLGRGVYRVFLKATGTDVAPVIDVGYIRLS